MGQVTQDLEGILYKRRTGLQHLCLYWLWYFNSPFVDVKLASNQIRGLQHVKFSPFRSIFKATLHQLLLLPLIRSVYHDCSERQRKIALIKIPVVYLHFLGPICYPNMHTKLSFSPRGYLAKLLIRTIFTIL